MTCSANVTWQGDDVIEKVSSAMQKALGNIAQNLKEQSNKQVPVKSGALRDSSNIDASKLSNNQVKVTYNTSYAAQIHEGTSYKHTGQGKAKYLSQPLGDNTKAYEQMIAESLRRIGL